MKQVSSDLKYKVEKKLASSDFVTQEFFYSMCTVLEFARTKFETINWEAILALFVSFLGDDTIFATTQVSTICKMQSN